MSFHASCARARFLKQARPNAPFPSILPQHYWLAYNYRTLPRLGNPNVQFCVTYTFLMFGQAKSSEA
ncbi:hypothetical protein BJV74DRAFT_369275 [Russula compacta]|nr:hypothetical protein BJV74DRAFT_369275 [Russula compacta]